MGRRQDGDGSPLGQFASHNRAPCLPQLSSRQIIDRQFVQIQICDTAAPGRAGTAFPAARSLTPRTLHSPLQPAFPAQYATLLNSATGAPRPLSKTHELQTHRLLGSSLNALVASIARSPVLVDRSCSPDRGAPRTKLKKHNRRALATTLCNDFFCCDAWS